MDDGGDTGVHTNKQQIKRRKAYDQLEDWLGEMADEYWRTLLTRFCHMMPFNGKCDMPEEEIQGLRVEVVSSPKESRVRQHRSGLERLYDIPEEEIQGPRVIMNGKVVISSMLGVKEPDKVTINNPCQSTTKGSGCFSSFKPEVTIEEKGLFSM
ncbi:hypothetical protein Tco_0716444 [Tanacetum coccineum]